MRLCAAPERKNKQRISHERGILFFVFSTMYGDTETKKRGGKNGWRAHTGPVLKKSNPESEDETWEKEKVFSNGF